MRLAEGAIHRRVAPRVRGVFRALYAGKTVRGINSIHNLRSVNERVNMTETAEKISNRTRKTTERNDTDQTRRTVLRRSGMALMAGLGGLLTPKTSIAQPADGDLRSCSAGKTGAKLELNLPTPAEFVKLGECLSYMCHLPAGARVHDITATIGTLMKILNSRDMPATRKVFASLRIYGCHYGNGSIVLSDESKIVFAEKATPVSLALEAEISSLGSITDERQDGRRP
jgi:hypothetical protein